MKIIKLPVIRIEHVNPAHEKLEHLQRLLKEEFSYLSTPQKEAILAEIERLRRCA